MPKAPPHNEGPRSRKTAGTEPREAVAQAGTVTLPADPTFRKSRFGRPSGTGNNPSYKVPLEMRIEIARRELIIMENTAARIEHERRKREQEEYYGPISNHVRSVLELDIIPQEFFYGSRA